MRPVVLCGVSILAAMTSLALAQEADPDEMMKEPAPVVVDPDVDPAMQSTHPQHIIVPDPFEDLDQPATNGGRRGRGSASSRVRGRPEPTVPPRIARDVPRPVEGEAPQVLHGRYRVVEITEAGVTEDYPNKMERAGRALGDDCIITQRVFDFGPLPFAPEGEEIAAHLPPEVTLIRLQECEVGGLGTYVEELMVTVPTPSEAWTQQPNALGLVLPESKVTVDYVRLKKSGRGDMPTPLQSLAPQSELEGGPVTYLLIAEAARRRGTLPVLHLTTGDQVLHLEADPEDSVFDVADREAAAAAAEGDAGAP